MNFGGNLKSCRKFICLTGIIFKKNTYNTVPMQTENTDNNFAFHKWRIRKHDNVRVIVLFAIS